MRPDTMRLMFVVVLSIGLAGAAAAEVERSTFDHAAMARHALERHIRPGYERFASASGRLSEAMLAYCRAPSTQSRAVVEATFGAAVVAWGRIEHITFGPVAQNERFERIMFWPDRRGIGARQLANALRNRDPSVVDAERLGAKSVAIQGLPALDTLLFAPPEATTPDPEAERHRCAFASAVAVNLERISKTISDEWSQAGGYARTWLSPGAGNPVFLKPSETTLALAKALDHGIEKVRDQRIGGLLGLNPQRRKTTPVLPYGNRTPQLIAANIEGLLGLYVEGGMESAILTAADAPSKASKRQLTRLVSMELATAYKEAAQIARAASASADQDSSQARRLVALGFPLKNAREIAGTLLAELVGLPLGFNASDGD